MRTRFVLLALAGLVALGTGVSDAATSTTTVAITIAPPMKITVVPAAPTIACETAAGTAIAAMSLSGGTGGAVAYAASGSADFAASGSSLVVGSNGIATADCGKTINVTITATQ